MDDCLLDSDVIIWFLRGKKEVVAFVKGLAKENVLGCSPLSIIEIMPGMKKGEEESTKLFFDTIKVWEITKEIATEAARYIMLYRKKGITIDFVDATIASTCKVNNLMLMTYKTEHYPMQEVMKCDMPPLTV